MHAKQSSGDKIDRYGKCYKLGNRRWNIIIGKDLQQVLDAGQLYDSLKLSNRKACFKEQKDRGLTAPKLRGHGIKAQCRQQSKPLDFEGQIGLITKKTNNLNP